jgi:hypothetical protein
VWFLTKFANIWGEIFTKISTSQLWAKQKKKTNTNAQETNQKMGVVSENGIPAPMGLHQKKVSISVFKMPSKEQKEKHNR